MQPGGSASKSGQGHSALFCSWSPGPFQSLDYYVDFLAFRPHLGIFRPPLVSRPASVRVREVLEDIADNFEDAAARDDFHVLLHWPGSPPVGISVERYWNEDSLLFAISDALAPTVPHYDLAVHFSGAIPRGTEGFLHLLLDVDGSLDSQHTLLLLDGRPLRPSGPPFCAVRARCDLHIGELFCLVRDAFPSAQLPAHLRVNGRLLTSMLQLHYYCPLVRAMPAMPPAETASLDFLDSSALPVEEVVNCFPGLSVDLQRARASSTTSTTTGSSCFVADLASTTSTTLPGSAGLRSARVVSSDSPALSQASASIDAVASSYTAGVALAAPGFAGVSQTAPSCRCVLTCLDGVPLRFFLSSPSGHVEALTLSGSLPVEDVLTKLCWQLAGSSVLFNDVQLLACDRAFVDADLGLSIFIA